MAKSWLSELWPGIDKPVIGMLHAPPLPGSPGFAGDFQAAIDHVLRDADTLCAGGVNGLMLENFGDTPFYPARVPQIVIAALGRLAAEIRRQTPLPLGFNVLRNDGLAALALATTHSADMIRVNVLCGARVTDQGLVSGIAHDLLRERATLHAPQIRILADVDVKHSAPLGPERPLADEVADLVQRGHADAVIVSGRGTGAAVDPNKLRAVKEAAANTPTLVGSGATATTARELATVADAFIVGTSLKKGGDPRQPVDGDRVRAFIAQLR